MKMQVKVQMQVKAQVQVKLRAKVSPPALSPVWYAPAQPVKPAAAGQ